MRCVCGGLGGFMVTWFDNKKEEEASPDDEALPLPGARGLPGQRGLEQRQFDDVDHSQHPVTRAPLDPYSPDGSPEDGADAAVESDGGDGELGLADRFGLWKDQNPQEAADIAELASHDRDAAREKYAERGFGFGAPRGDSTPAPTVGEAASRAPSEESSSQTYTAEYGPVEDYDKPEPVPRAASSITRSYPEPPADSVTRSYPEHVEGPIYQPPEGASAPPPGKPKYQPPPKRAPAKKKKKARKYQSPKRAAVKKKPDLAARFGQWKDQNPQEAADVAELASHDRDAAREKYAELGFDFGAPRGDSTPAPTVGEAASR